MHSARSMEKYVQHRINLYIEMFISLDFCRSLNKIVDTTSAHKNKNIRTQDLSNKWYTWTTSLQFLRTPSVSSVVNSPIYTLQSICVVFPTLAIIYHILFVFRIHFCALHFHHWSLVIFVVSKDFPELNFLSEVFRIFLEVL